MAQRRLDITQRQVRALAEGAKKAGCVAVVEIGNTVVKLVPEDRAILKEEIARIDAEEEDIGL